MVVLGEHHSMNAENLIKYKSLVQFIVFSEILLQVGPAAIIPNFSKLV